MCLLVESLLVMSQVVGFLDDTKKQMAFVLVLDLIGEGFGDEKT